MKTILITGVAGFIGSNVCEELLEQGYHVIGIDNFDPFYDKKIKIKNIERFEAHSRFKFYEIDICDINLASFEEKFDIVIHLAGKGGVLSSINNIGEYLNANILGTKNILELMRVRECNKIIFSSSSSVYGNSTTPAYSENCTTDYPLSPYATTKKTGELLLYNYHLIFKFDVIILRLFSVYGKRMRPDLALYKFVKNIKKDVPITIFGDGSSKRDYTYISDVVNAIISSIKFISENDCIYDKFNIGSNDPKSINDVVFFLYELLNKKPNIIYAKANEAEIYTTCADILHARIKLGYRPKTLFSAGVSNFIQWYNSINSQ